MKEDTLIYKLAVNKIPFFGVKTLNALLTKVDSLEYIFQASKRDIAKLTTSISKFRLNQILEYREEALKKAELEFQQLEKHEITPHYFKDEAYPRRLKEIPDTPIILYVRGKVDLNQSRVISIVGTRKPSDYGEKFTYNLLNELSVFNPTIISGMAFGIDIHAQKTANELGLQTIGIMAHGLEQVYPTLHTSLAKKFLQNGGLVSEYPPETKIKKEFFPRRNRILAGLSDAVIVIESPVKGGTLITAECAFDYNREVFALPGRITDLKSAGCNNLIKQNKAVMITGSEDIITAMDWDIKKAVKQIRIFTTENDVEQAIYDIIKTKDQVNINELAILLDKNISEINQHILTLELNGVIKSLPGSIYKLR